MKKAIDKLTAAALSLSMLASLCPMAAASVEGDVLHWDFSEYTEESVAAEGELTENYGGLEVHMNDGDVMTGGGLIWSAPGTTTSDDKTVANNRYIVFTPEVSGNISITFSGSIYNSKSKAPRMYIVPGEDPSCMSKTNSDTNGSAATATGADRETVLTAELDAGETYYIWPYYYNSSECAFTVSDITYSAAVPEMKTRNIYESNMLLQRDEPVYIDGTCSAAVTEATVSLKNEDTQEIVDTVTADVEDREWSAVLDPVSDYESTYTLTISADGMEDIVYTNIIFGDQYLFSGQSNMWKQVSYYRNIDPDTYSESEVSKHLTDKIRVMYTPGQSDYGTAELQFDAQNKQPWRDFSSYANIRDISAVAYKTAVKLHEETGVPIGIIDNPYPGSYISSWFDSALAIDDCNLGKNGNSNERNWYCGRIYPIRNLKLSGIFWYQGCADAATTYHDDPYTYYSDMMSRLIDSWRELFGDGELPFYYTQLTRIGSTIVDENNPNTGAASKMPIKLAQTDVYLNMEDKTNVGLVGTLDVYGAYEYPGTANDANCRNDIHCGQKQLVGDRMANLALIDIYGRESDSDGNKLYRMGPIYKSSRRSDSSVIVTFDCSGRLAVMPSERYTDEVGAQKIADGEFDPNVLNEFELAGEDGVWYPAKAEITADNEVTVTSEDISEPVMVRYANRDYSESPNLTDESGLPSYVFSKMVETEEEPPAGTPTAAPSATPTAGPMSSPDVTPEAEKHTVTFDYGSGRTEKVTVADGDTVSELPEAPSKRVIELNENAEAGPAQLIRADYGDDGSLSKVSFTETTISDGQKELELPEADNEKYMLWDSMSGMRPLGIEKTKHAVWVANGIEFTADTPITADVSVTAVYDYIAPTTEPTAAPTAEPTGLPDYEETYSFDFGADRNEGGTFTVDHATAYGEHENGMTYGLINIDEASVIDDIRFDGFSDDVITYVRDGEIDGTGYVAADYEGYDEETLSTFGDGVIPVRFAAEAEPDAYYTVSATVVNTSDTESAEVSLFGENRYAILYNHTLAPGESITKTWNVNLVGQYYNATGAYTDTAVNVTVAGKNAGLAHVDVSRHKEAGKTIWLMTDSTGDNSSASLPYFGLRGKCGVGQMLTKYINPEIAVNNQGEGGLNSSDRNHFNNALKHMKAGDYLYIQYGFNGETTDSLLKNLPSYYEAAHERGVKTIVVSTTERQSSSFWNSKDGTWTPSNAAIAEAEKQYVEDMIADGADDIAFVDLNTAMNGWMNETVRDIMEQRNRLGFKDEALSRLAMNYYYGYDRDSGVDNIHINDAGADNAAYLVMSEMKKTAAGEGVQAETVKELTLNAPDAEPYVVSDKIVSRGWIPNESYPYPLPNEVTYEYPTIVKGIDINGGEVSSISVMVQGDMQYYALGAVDILGSDGSVLRTEYSVSTDINPLIGHIDNTACSYGEMYTMNFENVSVADGESVRAYTVALQSGEEVPTGERYSSYYVPEQTESVLMNEDFADGIDGWKEGGSSAVKETVAVQKDGKSAIKLSQNGSGTYNVYKRFDDNAEADNGIVRVRFMINYSYGSFTIKLSPATDTGSYVEGLKLIDVKDGVLSFEDGTEIGRIKTGKWTDVECRIDLINGTLTASVAGGTPKTIEKEELASENESELDGLLPFRGFAAAYMATGSTIPSYSYETYISELVVDTVSCELPSYTVTAEAETGSEDRGTVSGGGKFDVNETATVNAKAADGYEFAGWYDELGNEISGLSEYSFRIRGDKKLYARFEEEVIDPNVTKWSFSAFRDGAEIFAESEESVEYNGLTIHVNGGDSVTEEGVYWNAPGGISSDSTTTVTNNRYIEFVPEKSGTISITYKGSLESGSNYPRMYISCGDSLACTTKDASAAQLEPNKQFDNKEGDGRYATMTADLTAGNHYYIWAYYYNRPGANFTISEISYDTNQK